MSTKVGIFLYTFLKGGNTLSIAKAYEITDVKISFVSLVDKAANQRQFLITKEDGKVVMNTRIIKRDSEKHFITGIVYEPNVEDSQGEFMTASEIEKAAYWFAKNGDKVDLQHNFEECPSCTVVENWVAKADFSLDGQDVKKGTWLVTVEVTDDALWEKVEKGEITGFSMGGIGVTSEIDVPLEKQEEKKGLLSWIAKTFGLTPVEKGVLTDNYTQEITRNNLWTAMYNLMDLLDREYYDYSVDRWKHDVEHDGAKIREYLTDFVGIINDLLVNDNIYKAVMESKPEDCVAKAGKKMSGKNQERLNNLIAGLTEFAKEFDEEIQENEEENDVKKSELEKMVAEQVKKALNPTDDVEVTAENASELVSVALKKALGQHEPTTTPEPSEPVKQEVDTSEEIAKAAEEAVKKVLEPLLKGHGVGNNLNDESIPVEKSDSHYLDGIL